MKQVPLIKIGTEVLFQGRWGVINDIDTANGVCYFTDEDGGEIEAPIVQITHIYPENRAQV